MRETPSLGRIDLRLSNGQYSVSGFSIIMPLPTTHRRMTACEYFELPEGPPYFQLVHGELFMSPSPVIRHQKVLLKLARASGNFLDNQPLGEVIMAPSDVELGGGDVYQPDLYFVSHARLEILDKQGAKGAPDLVVEILSPSTAQLDRQMKREVYERAGVREIWFVDLWDEQVEIHRFPGSDGAPTVTTLRTGDRLTTALLPGWSFAVANLLG
jgi:Uma2 family endonuclease